MTSHSTPKQLWISTALLASWMVNPLDFLVHAFSMIMDLFVGICIPFTLAHLAHLVPEK